ncbi:hypothetical protein V492_06083 [Pseudogymnoascus sp. VKM F-4246]|nr:hypothetical protein V492_06083 [Pseudogymnoascus sp. VKM F-4246]
MAPLPQVFTLPFFSPSTPPINSPRHGPVFGSGPNATVSYFYPLSPSEPARTAFATGTWPHDRAAVPKTIYECDPPSSQSFEARLYTCFNEEIEFSFSENVVIVPGAEVKEAFKSGEGGLANSRVKVGIDTNAPERIRDYQLKKAEESPKCDGRTGVAIEPLHWGAWQHSCFDGPSEWAVRGRKTRGEVLRERAEKGYAINMRIKRMWEEKNEEVKVIDGWKGSGKEKAVLEREERFWKESFEIREEGREVDEGVEREFERRMKGEVWGEVVEEYRSWEKEGNGDEEECQEVECPKEAECPNDTECPKEAECPKKVHCRKKEEKAKAPEKPKEDDKPKEPQHPTLELGKSHYDRPKAMSMKAKVKPAEIKVKEKNGKIKVKVKDGHAEIRVKGKDGKMRVKVKDKAGKIKVKSG